MDDDAADDHRADRMELVLERGDDAEVAAAAAQRPDQIGVLTIGRVHQRAVGKDDVGAEQIVRGHAVATAQPAEAAAEREAGDAGVADGAAGRRQPECLRFSIELRPPQSGLGPGRLRGRVDANALHLREVDDHAVVARAPPGDVVGAAADRKRQVRIAREVDGGDDVRRGPAADDGRRTPVDDGVPDTACIVVAGVGRRDDVAAHRRAQAFDRLRLDRHETSRS